jgi:hypothetical protein
VSKGFARLLPASLQILGLARTHVRALEVADEEPLKVIPTIDDISRLMVQPGSSGI